MPTAVPLIMVAVTFTVPAAVVRKMLPLTIDAPVVPALFTLHVIDLFVALDGTTVPERGRSIPAVADEGTSVMFVTGTNAALTVRVAALDVSVYGGTELVATQRYQ